MVIVVIGSLVIAFAGVPSAVLAAHGLQLAASVIIFIGYWKFTEPDPGFVGTEKPGSARDVARFAAIASIAISGIQTGLNVLGVASPRGASPMALLVGLLLLAGIAAGAVQFFAIMRYTRWVAGRVPDQYIVGKTRTYIWLLPLLYTVGLLLLGFGPLIALVLYWNLLDRLRKHLRSIASTGQPAKLPKMAG